MISLIRDSLLSNKILKIISIILGYSIWCLLGSYRTTQQLIKVPVCFYNIPENISVSTPEHIQIQLEAKRNEFALLDTNTLAVHIDASELQIGKQNIEIKTEQLFLPHCFKMVYYNPMNLIVELVEKHAPTNHTSDKVIPIDPNSKSC